MFTALLLLLAIAGPMALAWFFGWWVLALPLVLVAAVFLFSTGKARGAELRQGGRLTGYSETSYSATGFSATRQ